jgi:hypothetical protein
MRKSAKAVDGLVLGKGYHQKGPLKTEPHHAKVTRIELCTTRQCSIGHHSIKSNCFALILYVSKNLQL